MVARIKIPPKEVLEEMYIERYMTQWQISQEFDVCHRTVSDWMSHYGIQARQNVPIPPKDVLERMYVNEGMTQPHIAKEFGVRPNTVSGWFKNHCIRATRRPPKYVLERMYNKESKTQRQISKELDVVESTVNGWLYCYGISALGHMGSPVEMPQKEEIEKLIAKGLNQHQIAEHFNVCDGTIFNWCDQYGIPGMVNSYRCMTDEHKAWRYDVFERDHHACQMCGATDNIIHPHHIIPYADHPELAYELDNGITLCEQCHKSIRGYEYNYSHQFLMMTQPQFYTDEIAKIFDRKGVEIFGGEMP